MPESTVKHLNPVEKQLCKLFPMVENLGMHGRTVPAQLTAKFEETVDCIITNRRTRSVPDDDECVFANSSPARYIRCNDVLRRFSVQCGAQAPETLRSTKLRKHIVTVSQAVNLKDNELDLLAQFLGYNVG